MRDRSMLFWNMNTVNRPGRAGTVAAAGWISTPSGAPAGADAGYSTQVADSTRAGRPSISTRKSAAWRPRIGCPRPSVTRTSTSTRATSTRSSVRTCAPALSADPASSNSAMEARRILRSLYIGRALSAALCYYAPIIRHSRSCHVQDRYAVVIVLVASAVRRRGRSKSTGRSTQGFAKKRRTTRRSCGRCTFLRMSTARG